MTTGRQLVFNVSTTFTRQVAVTVFQLSYTVLLARLLGNENFGIYAMGLMFPQLFMRILNMGMGPSIVYFLSRKQISYHAAFIRMLQLALIVSLFGILLGLTVVLFVSGQVFPGIPERILMFSLLLFPLLILQELLPNMLLGLQKFNAYNISYAVFPSVSLLVAWILLTFFDAKVEYAILAFGAGQLASVIWLLYIIRGGMRAENQAMVDEINWKDLLSFSWRIHLGNIVGFLNYRIDMFLVNLLGSPASLAVYFIAVQIVEKLWLLSQAVNTVIFPHLSEKYLLKSKDTSVTTVLSVATFLSTLAVSLILAFFASSIIEFFFGASYKASTKVLIILIPGILATVVGRVLSNDFAARGRPELNIYVGILTIVANVVANIILIPSMGAEGAAWATTMSYALNLLIKFGLFRYYFGVPFWQLLIPGKTTSKIIMDVIKNWKTGEKE